jgi:hypothetical protein
MSATAKLKTDAEHYADACAYTKLPRATLIAMFMRSNAHFYGVPTSDLPA